MKEALSKTSRRSFLSTIAIAVPAIAAALPAAPALAVTADGLDRPGSLARMEQVVDLLHTCYVREGWKIDNEAAARALAFMRQFAKDGSEPDDGREATLDFLHSHGQSLDWVFCGDVGGMICGGAAHSERASSTVDAELLILVERWFAAEAEFCRLNRIWDRMPRSKRPAKLRIRESDAALSIPQPDRPQEYYSGPEVNCMRDAKWRDKAGSSFVDDGDTVSVTLRNFTPSAEARARADEIVAAFDKSWKRANPAATAPLSGHRTRPPKSAAIWQTKSVRSKLRPFRAHCKSPVCPAIWPRRGYICDVGPRRSARHGARRKGGGVMDNIVKFQCAERPLVESYDDNDNLRHAEHFRCLHTRIDDCASMSVFATGEMERVDDGKHPELVFAVYHLAEMVLDLRRHYHAAYKGEIEP
jgi:hypothetical protein